MLTMRRLHLFIGIVWSLLTLRVGPLYAANAEREIIHSFWYSHDEHAIRRVDIYIPTGCREDVDTPLTPLYLIHGINGYEGSWVELGNAIDTLEKFIEEGLCKPMILILPDCNKWQIPHRPIAHGEFWKCVFFYPQLSHEHQIEYALSDLMDMIDTTYCVTQECAVAGLSDGARISCNIANLRPDRVKSVGLFSPVLHKAQLPKDTTQNYAIYVGKNDLFYSYGHRFHKRMCKANITHEWVEMQGNHDWPVWQECLARFLLTVF